MAFPDITVAISRGETIEQTLTMTLDALEATLDLYLEGSRAIPELSRIERVIGSWRSLATSRWSCVGMRVESAGRGHSESSDIVNRTVDYDAGDKKWSDTFQKDKAKAVKQE